MTRSIRARLLAGVVGGMGLLLLAFAVAAYEGLSLSLVRSFDAMLAATARTLAAAVEQNASGVKADFAETDLSSFHRADRPDAFQIWHEDGRELASSLPEGAAPLSQLAGETGEVVFETVRLADGRRARAAGLRFVPAIDDEGLPPSTPVTATLVVARGTEDLDSQLRGLFWLLAIGTCATIALSLVVGAVAVRHGLRPLDSLAARIAAIRHDNLAASIPAGPMPRELAPLVERLNDLLARLEHAFQRERTFTADAAHELRTPLAGLRSTIEVSLMRTREASEYREALAACRKIVEGTQALVDNLLDLARLESGRVQAHPECLDLAEIVDATWEPFADQARQRGLTVERRIPAELLCRSDRAALQLALGAAFTNAVDYADAGGRIAMAADTDGRTVGLEISNTGCALDPEDAPHVFERFWRGDRSRAGAGAHCGLGLALAERAMTIAGGSVAARVSEGVFTLRIVLQAAGPEDLGPESAAGADVRSGPRSAGPFTGESLQEDR